MGHNGFVDHFDDCNIIG